MTSLILLFIRFVCRIPLRMSDADLLIGDEACHGENAYTWGDAPERSLLHGDTGQVPINGDGELGIIQGKTPTNGDEIGPVAKKEGFAYDPILTR
jgi:Amt family ammonium transporter